MNVLFLTIAGIGSIKTSGIYTDLLRCFAKEGHSVYVVCAREKRTGMPTEVVTEENVKLLKVRIGNITKSGLIEKGIATINIKRQYLSAIRRYFSGIKFDLILYATPPVTLAGVIKRLKNNGAKTYLMLKDIFPENTVGLGVMSEHGIKGIIYRYFRKKEKKLYAVSDRIGCTSPAALDYILQHNPELDPNKMELCPNCIEIVDKRVDENQKMKIRKNYGIPQNKTVFLFAGNFGRGHDFDFIIRCLQSQINNQNSFFLFVGGGTEYGRLENYANESLQPNLRLLKMLPVEEYENIARACDVGLIFIGWNYSTPESPSRLLSYLQAGLPVLAVTGPITDVGKIVEENNAGIRCDSNSVEEFCEKIHLFNDQKRRKEMGECAYNLLCEKYDIEHICKAIQKMMLEDE